MTGPTVAKRPWYLVLAMCLMWVFGATSAASGCSNVSYLRGNAELPETVDRLLAQSQTEPGTGLGHPIVRASLVREQARLAATSTMQKRAFPLALGQLLLGLTLVVAAAAAMAGRPGWRELAMQVVAANALLALASFSLLAPVRSAMASAVAVEMVDHGGALDQGLGRDGSIAERKRELSASEVEVVLAEVALLSLGVLALGRARTREFFAANEAAALSAEQHPEA